MVLKDAGGLVKLYALVNVEKYSLVATGSNQEEAMAEYKRLLREEGIITDEDDGEGEEDTTLYTEKLTISAIDVYTVNGESVFYLTVSLNGEKVILEQRLADNKGLLFIEVGESYFFTFKETETPSIYTIVGFIKDEVIV